MQDIENLNRQFALADMLTFTEGPNGLVMINIQTPQATARISAYGAQVLSFKPTDTNDDLFFLSPQSAYGDGKAIRGGVPICWPWFGDDPSGYGRPAHGFARNQVWDVVDTNQADNGVVRVILQLLPNEVSRKYWHCEFKLQLSITVGENLTLALTTENTDTASFVISQALHTYFNIGDVEHVRLRGLDKYHYLDKTLNFAQKLQQGDINFVTETDRIYLQSPEQLFIEDPTLARRVIINSQGSQTAVVWNPWNKAVNLADMDNNAYQRFICVETANAADNSIELAPGEVHTLTAQYQVLPRD